MPKQLILMRHAKSSWDDSGLSDHDRGLNERGWTDARRMGLFLKEEGWLPQAALLSTAERARRTWERIEQATDWSGDITETYQLYLARPERIVQVIQRSGGAHETVLVLGHNPGLQEMVELWTDHTGKFPTAAIAKLTFDIDDWMDLTLDETCQASVVIRPKQVSLN